MARDPVPGDQGSSVLYELLELPALWRPPLILTGEPCGLGESVRGEILAPLQSCA